MTDERIRRVGENEALFRQVNETIKELNESFAGMTGGFAIACECGDALCTEQVSVPRDLYERTRQDASRFILKPGHQVDDTERVVERGEVDSYVVVEKVPAQAKRIAEQTDPTR